MTQASKNCDTMVVKRLNKGCTTIKNRLYHN